MSARLRAALLIGIGLTVGLASVVGQQGPPPPATEYVPDEVLVQFQPGYSSTQRAAIVTSKGAVTLKKYDTVHIERLRIAPGQTVEQAVASFRATTGVVSADPNTIHHVVAPPLIPNDSLWPLYGMQKIMAPEAWGAFGTNSSAVIVADIDTGTSLTHPDLIANLWTNPGETPNNGIDDDLNGYVDDVFGINAVNGSGNPMDDHGHGTHTAGTIGAVGNNGQGVVGVNWNVRILTCKFLNSGGSGSDADAIECFNYITMMKNRGQNIRVSNSSWGGGGFNQGLKDAMNAAGTAGIINICAAGNAGGNNDNSPFYPASYGANDAVPSIIAVAASDQNDARANFSNVGPTTVHLAAPGVSIMSTYRFTGPPAQDGYASLSGTSMATPHVAGAAAFLARLDPSLSVASIKQLLLSTVDHLPQWQGFVQTGGRLNLFAAASAVGVPALTNFALAANGGTAAASSTFSPGYSPAGAINGDRRGQPWGAGGGWNDGTPGDFSNDWLEVTFNGVKSIQEVNVFSVQDNYLSPVEPAANTTFSLYGLQSFQVQYLSGGNWLTVPGGSVAANNLVWKRLTFSPVTTTKIRVLVTQALASWSRIAEVEALGTAVVDTPPTVSLDSPPEGTVYTAPATVHFAATASDADGSVSLVEFFANGVSRGSDTTSPYAFDWAVSAPGDYTLTAVATDNLGATTTSNVRHITVNPPVARINVALAANGGTAAASTTFSGNYSPAGAINGDRRGQPWGAGGGWNDSTPNDFTNDWLEVTFNGPKSIDEVDVFSVQDNYLAPIDPAPGTGFSLYGLQDFQVQYFTGVTWQNVSGGSIVGNNLVWRQITFSPVTATKVRVLITRTPDAWSRVAELEAYGTPAGGPSPTNVALAANGASATASSTFSAGYDASGAINGDRRGQSWGAGGGWNDGTPNDWSNDWLQITFNGSKTISEIDVFSVQDNYLSPIDPSLSTTFSLYGLSNFRAQYWNGATWIDIPGASVTGNNLVWRQFTFAPITTTQIRIVVTLSLGTWTRITEVEAYTSTPPPPEPAPAPDDEPAPVALPVAEPGSRERR